MTKISFPRLFVFNPTCEYAVANGMVSWQPNKLLQKMEKDMATLPAYFATTNDIIAVPHTPSSQFMDEISKVLSIPQFKTLAEILKKPPQHIKALMPWGWSPATHKLLHPLKPLCSTPFKASPVFEWKTEYRELYSKVQAARIQRQIIEKYPHEIFIEESQLTEVCTTQSEIEQLLLRWGKLMTKAPWSSSGRGLQPIRKTPVHAKVWEKVLGIVKEQGAVIVEPYHNKVLDMAFQFKVEKQKVSFVGISNFITDEKGQYCGNRLNGLPANTPEELLHFIDNAQKTLIPILKTELEQSSFSSLYEGYLGVDTLIFRGAKNELRINPCQEINLRLNMGLLSIHLEQLLLPQQQGLFKTWFRPGQTFDEFAAEMRSRYPLVTESGKIKSGFLTLTDSYQQATFGAYILV